jgi:Ca-activated chloride channel homolog
VNDRGRRLLSQIVAVVVGVGLILYLRGTFNGDDAGPSSSGSVDIGDCMPLSVTASSEKAALLGQMAQAFNATQSQVDGRCVGVTVTSKSSGATMDALAREWDENVDGPRPDVWTPAASSWVVLLRQRLAERDATNIVPDDTPSIAWSPLVIAMPQPMAEALGWPHEAVGWSDIFRLAEDPDGWGSVGHPEWGEFRLGKTNPNYSTSGLHALVGAYFAATGLTSDLTLRDIRQADVRDFVSGVESSVYHYGDITLTFLQNFQRADDEGRALSYVSAVTIEEKSVWDYNQGNPSGSPATLGQHAPPSVPLVAIYPKEGTLASDHPWVVLNAPWVDDAKRQAAGLFLNYVLAPEQQRIFQDFAFRNAQAEPGDKISQANGLLPDQPTARLLPPSPQVLDAMLRSWEDLRKRARVLLLIDVSGSMGQSSGTGPSKIDLAKEAAIEALDLFAPDDDVGLWVFTTDLPTGDYQELVPIGPLGSQRDQLRNAIADLRAQEGTPLYTAIGAAADQMRQELDPDRINGVIVLSDGQNDDPNNDCLDCLLDDLDSELNVRVFPIAYGQDAELSTLQAIADASRAHAYDATDPTAISDVFVEVISNF